MRLLLLGVLPCVSSDRTVYDFNLGWRYAFQPPTPPLTCNATSFTLNTSDTQCNGLIPIYGATTVPDCVQAACDAGASYWQLGLSVKPPVASCWVGTPNTLPCTPAKGAWLGGANPSTPPAFPFDTAPAALEFDDAAWEVVTVPHDGLIGQNYSAAQNNGQGNLPKQRLWYRKRIRLPTEWQGSLVSVYFEGVFSVASVFFNGIPLLTHSSGYTSFSVVLSNCSSVMWGSSINILSLHVDGFNTSGWWMEGAGIFRGVRITRSPLLRIADDGLFSPVVTDRNYTSLGPTPSSGATVSHSTLLPRLTVEHGGIPGGAEVSFSSFFSLYSPLGTLLGVSAFLNSSILPGAGPITLTPPENFTFSDLNLWSLARPYLYTLQATLLDGQGGLDSINVTLGVRDIAWSPTTGMTLNGQQGVKLRGFCNHASFAGIGMALPTRVHLVRQQQLRGLGGNALRMSHNPGSPSDMAIADALGIGVLDENRLFFDDAVDVSNMGDMVRRDRQHASVLWYSFCNEVGCGDGTQPFLDYKNVTNALDGTRAVTANMFAVGQVESLPNATEILDVQGFSHGDQYDFAWFKKHWPTKPYGATECCSCETQRLEDSDLPKAAGVYWSSWSQSCTSQQSQASNGPMDVSSTFVWTLHDYYGEPEGWPHISSGFGQIDLAGFPKAPSYWYRSWWLSNQPSSDPARPPLFSLPANVTIHLVESWAAPPPPPHPQVRTLHVYTSAPFVELYLNDTVLLGEKTAVASFQWASFTVPWSPGKISALALASDGVTPVGRHERFSWGPASKVILTLDAPTLATGTGEALYLDGTDVGLVRASIVDASGNLCADAVHNVTFQVTQGPGLIIGVGNGDPSSLHPNSVSWRPAYHGLSRGILRVTMDARGSDSERQVRASLEVEAGVGALSSSFLPPGMAPPTTITVIASAPGVSPSDPLVISVSADPQNDPIIVAAASVGTAWLEV